MFPTISFVTRLARGSTWKSGAPGASLSSVAVFMWANWNFFIF